MKNPRGQTIKIIFSQPILLPFTKEQTEMLYDGQIEFREGLQTDRKLAEVTSYCQPRGYIWTQTQKKLLFLICPAPVGES